MFQVKIGSYQDRNVPILIATSVLLVPHRPGIANDIKLVADPGFPAGGGADSPWGGPPTYDFAKFSQKLHEIERIWAPGGGGGASLAPPLRSATASRT